MFYSSFTTDSSINALLSTSTGNLLSSASFSSTSYDPVFAGTTSSSPLLLSNSAEPMQTFIGGDALAVGDDTSASGDIDVQSMSSGPLQISGGIASFSAAAQSNDGDPVYADANTYAGAEGADIVLAPTIVSSEGDDTYMAETSQTFLLAANIDGFDLPGGTLVIDPTLESDGLAGGGTPLVGGNMATFDADGEAQGNYTLVDVQYDVLTVDNQLSAVSGIVITEVA